MDTIDFNNYADIELMNRLKTYPAVYHFYQQSIKLIKENNYELAADTMKKAIDSMVDYIYSRCQSTVNSDASYKIDLLENYGLLTTSSYDNYQHIQSFQSDSLYGNFRHTAIKECQQNLTILGTEIKKFLQDYATTDYSNIAIKPIQDLHKFEASSVKLFSCSLFLGGGGCIWNGMNYSVDIFKIIALLLGITLTLSSVILLLEESKVPICIHQKHHSKI